MSLRPWRGLCPSMVHMLSLHSPLNLTRYCEISAYSPSWFVQHLALLSSLSSGDSLLSCCPLPC